MDEIVDKKTVKKWKVLIVDDQPANLALLGQVLKEDYELAFAQNGQKALEIVHIVKPDIILLDIMMPEMNGFEVCEKLKADSRTKKTPVIFITAVADAINENKGFSVGGVDYITKPITPSIVLARISTHLKLYRQNQICEMKIKKRTKELEESQRSAVYMLGDAGHYNDDFTGDHIWRMAHYSCLIASEIGWQEPDCELLKMAAPLHDTGKIGISDVILRKPGPLNPEEWKIMQQHTVIGYNILSKNQTRLFRMASEIALSHHERWDGQGYPSGLSGDEIPESARIVAIADVFDALTMERPYKKRWSVDESIEEIRKNGGAQFDPALVEVFISLKDQIKEDLMNG